jgi:hypothetical protein
MDRDAEPDRGQQNPDRDSLGPEQNGPADREPEQGQGESLGLSRDAAIRAVLDLRFDKPGSLGIGLPRFRDHYKRGHP